MSSGTESIARQLWLRIETLHAVTYFADESRRAATAAGLRGFWMGYFGFRAAPLGAASAGVVEAAFANFAPRMVQRSIPDAWTFASPIELVVARTIAAADSLDRIVPALRDVADGVSDDLEAIVAAAGSTDRPLFAANRGVPALGEPLQRLWQACTTSREHRGDGHVIALAAADIDGCAAHRLIAAEQAIPHDVLQANRGWTDDEWLDAEARLHERALLSTDGSITAGGLALRARIEALTDELARAPIDGALTPGAQRNLLDRLTPFAAAVAASGVIPYPNPMGLPRFQP